MKNNFLKSTVLKKRWRYGVLLFAVLCLIGSGFTRGTAQLKNHKRVTSLQLGESAEGARVTVVSDSALGDYEAFRRGDRFYVRIPLADFAASTPGFRGDGFDDVQVQTVGDSVVISFKLQPGASARVDQHSNRLDVVFSAPNRMARNNASNSVFNRVSSSATSGINRVNNAVNTQGRQGDPAGPIPPSTPQANRERLVGSRQNARQVTPDQQVGPNGRGSSKQTENSSSVANTGGAKSASPSTSPGSVLPSPTPYSYQPATSSTPVSSITANSQNWDRRSQLAREWILAHRMFLGALVILGLLLLIAALFYRRRKSAVKAKRGNEPRAQPKYSPNLALTESLAADALVLTASRQSATASTAASTQTSNSEATAAASKSQDEYKLRPVQSERPAEDVPVPSDRGARISALENVERSQPVPEPAMAGSAGGAVSPNHAWVLTKPSISSPASGDDQFASEDDDREVFEL